MNRDKLLQIIREELPGCRTVDCKTCCSRSCETITNRIMVAESHTGLTSEQNKIVKDLMLKFDELIRSLKENSND